MLDKTSHFTVAQRLATCLPLAIWSFQFLLRVKVRRREVRWTAALDCYEAASLPEPGPPERSRYSAFVLDPYSIFRQHHFKKFCLMNI